MSLALIAGAAQGLGSLLGGRKRDKAARNAERGNIIDRRDAVVMARQDQEEMLRLARDDEARLLAATGYDFVKLRADAEKAGFNPLTAFQLTGGAGYDGRGAVIMSPFISKMETFVNMSSAVSGARGTRVGTAGYLGDAISSAGSAFFDQFNEDRAANLDAARLKLARDELSMAAAAFGAPTVRQTTGVTQTVATPFGPSAAAYGPQLPKDVVRLDSMNGEVYIKKGAAERLGLEWGDYLTAGDYTELIGEVAGEIRAGAEIPFSNGPFVGRPKKGERLMFPSDRAGKPRASVGTIPGQISRYK